MWNFFNSNRTSVPFQTEQAFCLRNRTSIPFETEQAFRSNGKCGTILSPEKQRLICILSICTCHFDAKKIKKIFCGLVVWL
jgi:hypothetical protein